MKPLVRQEIRPVFRSLLASTLMAASFLVSGCSRSPTNSSSTASSAAQPSAAASAGPQAAAAQAAPAPPGPPAGAATAQQLEELVSPIALYPDTLVAQILAASTYPSEVVEAHRWLDQNTNLKGDQLAAAVNQQPWDPSIKSLCQYPSVLKTMNDSLSWTSTLGQAYYNQPTDVLNAIQVMRKRAMDAGTLKSTPQQTVQVQPAAPASETSGGESAVPAPQQTIIVNPAQPNTVYVPEYNPSSVYGAPVQSPPGYTGGELLATGLVSFGAGMLIGSLINNDNNNWGCNWGGGNVTYNHNVYVSNTNAIPARYRGGYYGPGYAGGVRPPYAPAGYPRPVPYEGGNRALYNPGTRPYNPATARQFANGGNFKEPTFPKPSQLQGTFKEPTFPKPNQLSGLENRNPPVNRPAQFGGNGFNSPSSPARNAFNNKPAFNPRNDPMRGYGNRGSEFNGGRNNAFGGYGPGRQTQEFSNRGRASFGRGGGFQGGGGGGFHGGSREFGGGGGRRRR